MKFIRKILKRDYISKFIELPSGINSQQFEVLVFPLETMPFPYSKPVANNYDFSDIAGKIKWKGNALKEQKKLRNEW